MSGCTALRSSRWAWRPSLFLSSQGPLQAVEAEAGPLGTSSRCCTWLAAPVPLGFQFPQKASGVVCCLAWVERGGADSTSPSRPGTFSFM